MHSIMWVWTSPRVQKQPLLLVRVLKAQIRGRWRLSLSLLVTLKIARDVGGDTFVVQLKNELEDKVSANVHDKGYGNYLVTYIIPGSSKRVNYTLSVRLRGAHIQGSPFTVHMASSLRRKTYKVLSDVASKITQHS